MSGDVFIQGLLDECKARRKLSQLPPDFDKRRPGEAVFTADHGAELSAWYRCAGVPKLASTRRRGSHA